MMASAIPLAVRHRRILIMSAEPMLAWSSGGSQRTARITARLTLWSIIVCGLFCLGVASGEELPASLKDGLIGKIERKITKEPRYIGSPHYALLILGADAQAKVWMVEDGNLL